MTKLSIFKPGKSKDYRFLDKLISQQFQVGGTLIMIHKYLGPVVQGNTGDATISSATAPDELTIQDILLIENRDRNYDPNIIDMKASYILPDIDFNLTQFGIMLNTNVLFLNFHINDMLDRLGRKLIPGDVIEIVHRKEEVPLNTTIPYIPAYYVVKDTARAADGYSPTWLAHILRVRVEPMPDSQEYQQILDQEIKNGLTLEDIITNGGVTQTNNDAIVAQGDANVPTKNFDSNNLYITSAGNTLTNTGGMVDWPFNNDGTIPNTNIKAPTGTRFPDSPMIGDWFLRTDYKPARLFQKEANRWCARQIVWRNRVWTSAPRTLEDFLEDITTTKIDNTATGTFTERQPGSDPLPNPNSEA